MKKRIEWIDLVRAVGMLLIVVGHSLGQYTGTYLGKVIFAVHVPLFFVVSGYLYKQQATKVVVKKGFFNLLLPYMATSILLYIAYFNWHIFPHGFSQLTLTNRQFLLEVAAGLGTSTNYGHLFVPSIGAIWFLLAMFTADIIFNFIVKVQSQVKMRYLDVLLTLICCVIGFWTAKYISLPWAFNAALISQPFYLFGKYLRQNDLLEQGKAAWMFLGILLWLFSAYKGFFFINIGYAANPLWAMLGAMGGSYALMYLAMVVTRSGFKVKWLNLYGAFSIIALCFHLIDIKAITLSSVIFNNLNAHYGPVLATVGMSTYRILLTFAALLVVPKVPFIRSFYLHRKYPFKKIIS